MSHPGGNRARFFPSQDSTTDVSGAVNASNQGPDATFSSATPSNNHSFSGSNTELNSQNTTQVTLSQRSSHIDAVHPSYPASGGSDGEIVAQRTRTTEIETLYKANAKKERSDQLNVSAFLRHANPNTKSIKSAPQRAAIQEIPEHEELEARSPRHYSGQKLISTNPSSPNVSSYSLSASNKMSSFKVPPSRQSLRVDSPGPDAFNNSERSPKPHSLSNNSHTVTQTSNENSIQGRTKAFNRRQSNLSRSTPAKIASPTQNTTNTEVSRGLSPRFSLKEAAGKIAGNACIPSSHRQREERQVIELEDDQITGESYQTIDHSSASEKESHFRHNSPERRGEKRLVGFEVDDLHASNHAGKRARTETYDDLLPEESRLSLSPEPDSVANQQNARSRFRSRADAPQDRFPGQDPQLRFFFGQDVEEYMSTHMERYEAATKRWSECTREEWEKGADELIEKFTQILDHVKDHVKRKVTLYASLHARVDEHQKSLEGTAEMLKEAKRQLVTKTGVVIEDGPAGFTI